MTTLREAVIAALRRSLPGWDVLDAAPQQPGPRPQAVVVTSWAELRLDAPPHRDLVRPATLRILCSWPIPSAAHSGGWLVVAEAAERTIWRTLVRLPEFQAFEISGWSSESGLDRLDSMMIGRLEVTADGTWPWGAEDPQDGDIETLAVLVSWSGETAETEVT